MNGMEETLEACLQVLRLPEAHHKMTSNLSSAPSPQLNRRTNFDAGRDNALSFAVACWPDKWRRSQSSQSHVGGTSSLTETRGTHTDRVRQGNPLEPPDIVRAIVEGRQPVGLTSSYLLHHPLPDDWEKQRVLVKTL